MKTATKSPRTFRDIGRLVASRKRQPVKPRHQVYIVTCDGELMMASHYQSDAKTYIKTYNKLKPKHSPLAVMITLPVEI